MSIAAARKGMGWRAAQQTGVQLIYFARLLILARLLAPEAFGLLAVAMIAVSVLMSLSDLGIVPALVQRTGATPDEHDAAWTIGLLRAATVAAALTAAAPLIAQLFDQPGATRIIQVLALRPLIDAMASIGIVQLTRTFRFRELALIYVPAALVDAALAIAMAGAWGVWALVGGALAGTATATMLSYILAPHRPRILLDFALAAPLIRFGRWVLGTSILGLVATAGVQLVISRQLGIAELGLYFLASKIAFLPADALRSVVSAVSFPLFVTLQDNLRATARTFGSLLTAQAVVLLPTYTIMIALAPTLADALGPRWADTAPLIRLIAAAAAGGLYADTVLPLMLGRGRPDRVMAIIGTQTAVILVAIVPLTSVFGVAGAAAAWLPAYGSALLASVLFTRHEVGTVAGGAGASVFIVCMASSIAGFVALAGPAWTAGVPALATGIVLGIAAAGGLLYVLNSAVDLRIGDIIRPGAAELLS
jgi:O-antigen/teichoic acid export membrane protein